MQADCATAKVDERKLSNALSLELGMKLKDLLVKCRTKEVQDYKQAHPECTTEELATDTHNTR